MNTANIRYREMAEIIIRKMHEEDWCAVRKFIRKELQQGTPPFRPQHLSGWNGMKGIFRTAATSPLLITEWWDGLRYLLFPPACIPRCRRAEHLCQYSFSGKGAGRALLSGLIKGSESAGFWTLLAGIFPENRASVALHRSRDSGSRLPGKSG